MPEFPEPDEDDFDFDLSEDEEEDEDEYMIYWLSSLPVSMTTIMRWASLNHLVVEADVHEVYLYWEADDCWQQQMSTTNLLLDRSFSAPHDVAWDFVQDEGHSSISRRRGGRS